MLVDKTSFGSVHYNHANFYRLRKHLDIGQLHNDHVFSAFHWSTSDTAIAGSPVHTSKVKKWNLILKLCKLIFTHLD